MIQVHESPTFKYCNNEGHMIRMHLHKVVWFISGKICKECSDLIPWFPSNLVYLSSIYSPSCLGLESSTLATIFTHTPFSSILSPQTLAVCHHFWGDSRDRRLRAPSGDGDRAEDWHRVASRVWIISFCCIIYCFDKFY
jgi:hypothetical protein